MRNACQNLMASALVLVALMCAASPARAFDGPDFPEDGYVGDAHVIDNGETLEQAKDKTEFQYKSFEVANPGCKKIEHTRVDSWGQLDYPKHLPPEERYWWYRIDFKYTTSSH